MYPGHELIIQQDNPHEEHKTSNYHFKEELDYKKCYVQDEKKPAQSKKKGKMRLLWNQDDNQNKDTFLQGQTLDHERKNGQLTSMKETADGLQQRTIWTRHLNLSSDHSKAQSIQTMLIVSLVVVVPEKNNMQQNMQFQSKDHKSNKRENQTKLKIELLINSVAGFQLFKNRQNLDQNNATYLKSSQIPHPTHSCYKLTCYITLKDKKMLKQFKSYSQTSKQTQRKIKQLQHSVSYLDPQAQVKKMLLLHKISSDLNVLYKANKKYNRLLQDKDTAKDKVQQEDYKKESRQKDHKNKKEDQFRIEMMGLLKEKRKTEDKAWKHILEYIQVADMDSGGQPITSQSSSVIKLEMNQANKSAQIEFTNSMFKIMLSFGSFKGDKNDHNQNQPNPNSQIQQILRFSTVKPTFLQPFSLCFTFYRTDRTFERLHLNLCLKQAHLFSTYHSILKQHFEKIHVNSVRRIQKLNVKLQGLYEDARKMLRDEIRGEGMKKVGGELIVCPTMNQDLQANLKMNVMKFSRKGRIRVPKKVLERKENQLYAQEDRQEKEKYSSALLKPNRDLQTQPKRYKQQLVTNDQTKLQQPNINPAKQQFMLDKGTRYFNDNESKQGEQDSLQHPRPLQTKITPVDIDDVEIIEEDRERFDTYMDDDDDDELSFTQSEEQNNDRNQYDMQDEDGQRVFLGSQRNMGGKKKKTKKKKQLTEEQKIEKLRKINTNLITELVKYSAVNPTSQQKHNQSLSLKPQSKIPTQKIQIPSKANNLSTPSKNEEQIDYDEEADMFDSLDEDDNNDEDIDADTVKSYATGGKRVKKEKNQDYQEDQPVKVNVKEENNRSRESFDKKKDIEKDSHFDQQRQKPAQKKPRGRPRKKKLSQSENESEEGSPRKPKAKSSKKKPQTQFQAQLKENMRRIRKQKVKAGRSSASDDIIPHYQLMDLIPIPIKYDDTQQGFYNFGISGNTIYKVGGPGYQAMLFKHVFDPSDKQIYQIKIKIIKTKKSCVQMGLMQEKMKNKIQSSMYKNYLDYKAFNISTTTNIEEIQSKRRRGLCSILTDGDSIQMIVDMQRKLVVWLLKGSKGEDKGHAKLEIPIEMIGWRMIPFVGLFHKEDIVQFAG